MVYMSYFTLGLVHFHFKFICQISCEYFVTELILSIHVWCSCSFLLQITVIQFSVMTGNITDFATIILFIFMFTGIYLIQKILQKGLLFFHVAKHFLDSLVILLPSVTVTFDLHLFNINV